MVSYRVKMEHLVKDDPHDRLSSCCTTLQKLSTSHCQCHVNKPFTEGTTFFKDHFLLIFQVVVHQEGCQYKVDSVYSPAFGTWGIGGTIRRRGHKTLLMLTEHTCVQLAMHTQWGPVSVVCTCSRRRCHMHAPVRVSQSLFSPPQSVTH